MKPMKVYLYLLLISGEVRANDIMLGNWLTPAYENGSIEFTKLNYYSEKLSYTKGGLEFNFPKQYFTKTPFIYVSIALNNLSYQSNLQYAPLIETISAQHVIVRITKQISGILTNSINETEDNEVFVYIFAFGH